MTAIVSTWADGFGVWHAKVPAQPHRHEMTAYQAIRKELEARQGAPLRAFGLAVVSEDDETITYRESWDSPTFHHPRCVLSGGDCFCSTFTPEEMQEAAQSVAALRARAQMLIPDQVMGTDLITVEVSGQEQDVILTQEDALYAHTKLSHLLGLDCSEKGCCA